MPNANNRPDYARAFRNEVGRGALAITPPPIAGYWHKETASLRAVFPLVGTPMSTETGERVVAFANLQLNARSPLLRASLIWEHTPIYRLDIGGSAHPNVALQPIPTPHRHCYREPDGLWECEFVDLVAVGIASATDHCAVARYFFDWCGLDVGALQWQNPPARQASLIPPMPPRFGSARRTPR